MAMRLRKSGNAAVRNVSNGVEKDKIGVDLDREG